MSAEAAARQQLWEGLCKLRLTGLLAHASAQRIPAAAVRTAMDSAEPKAALMQLCLLHNPSQEAQGWGDLEDSLLCGGEEAALSVGLVLDHAAELLEQQLLQTPRPERPPLRLLLQAVEDLEVSVDGERCDEIADGSAEQMHKVSAALVAVGSIASNLAADVVPAVTTLVEMLAE